MAKPREQFLFFRGIYEFEDPSGGLLAARVPQVGTADLFRDTVVLVRPNQRAMFIYEGRVAEMLGEGTHRLENRNVPILTRLANWKLNFQSPLRCDLWFFATNVFPARRWGTTQPVIHKFTSVGSVPIRAYGNLTVVLKDPETFYLNLVGGRTSYDITDLEAYLQGHLLELLPQALEVVKNITELNVLQEEVSQRLEKLLEPIAERDGLQVRDIQVLSLLPTQEVLEALSARTAMNLIGDKREYLLYKAANSLEGWEGSGSDPMQMMMGLMLGKGLFNLDYHERERKAIEPARRIVCPACSQPAEPHHRFCPGCGKEINP
jgi:membrane protease subunit (stomatin/prohibitin family)